MPDNCADRLIWTLKYRYIIYVSINAISRYYHRHRILSNRFAVGKLSASPSAWLLPNPLVGSHRLASPRFLLNQKPGLNHLILVSEMCVTTKGGNVVDVFYGYIR